MPEYRRFVAYIYKYVDGKRKENVGHVKITLRNEVVGIQLKVLAGAADEMQKLYCFLRKRDNIYGFGLWKGESRKGTMDLELTLPAEQLAKMGCPFQEWKGLWITGAEKRISYISVWDDDSVEEKTFLPNDESTEENKTLGSGRAVDEVKMEERLKELAEEQEIAERERTMGYAENEVSANEIGDSNDARLRKCWHQFQCQYPHVQPFPDKEITQCIQIVPKDLSFLGSKEFCYCNSPFVQHKYMKYRHLLLALHENGQFILGIPGLCRGNQDRHLAAMYGFPEFKKVSEASEKEGGEFGYWYHEIKD